MCIEAFGTTLHLFHEIGGMIGVLKTSAGFGAIIETDEHFGAIQIIQDTTLIGCRLLQSPCTEAFVPGIRPRGVLIVFPYIQNTLGYNARYIVPTRLHGRFGNAIRTVGISKTDLVVLVIPRAHAGIDHLTGIAHGAFRRYGTLFLHRATCHQNGQNKYAVPKLKHRTYIGQTYDYLTIIRCAERSSSDWRTSR